MTMMLSARAIKAECPPQIKRLLWFVFAGSRGGLNRIRIVLAIKERPINKNQLSKELGIDYKAIQHHLRVLEKNYLIINNSQKYGSILYLSPLLESHIAVFDEIITKMKESVKENFLGEKA